VIFTGGVTRTCVAELMRASDVFILNSSYEGLPHIVLEAFAAGVPVVAASAGGTPEVMADGGNGLLVPPGDSRRLAEALDTLLAREDLAARFVEGGRRTIAEGFRWDTLLDQTERTLRSAAERKGGAA
jgi:glycosyltransferase involved in cell wall biosynthesis